MKKTLLLTLLFLSGLIGTTQDKETLRKIEAAKIALITERLDLTPTEAEKFWPIYNEYRKSQRQLNSEFRQARKNFDPAKASEEESKKLLELGIQIKERKVELNRQYSEKLLQVISNKQMLQLRQAEEDFRKMLLDRVRERQRMRERTYQRNLNQLQDTTENE